MILRGLGGISKLFWSCYYRKQTFRHFRYQNWVFGLLVETIFDKFSLKVYIIVLAVNRNHLHYVFISIETLSDVFINVEKSSQKRQILASANLLVTWRHQWRHNRFFYFGTYSRKSMLSIDTPYVALILKGKLFIFYLKSQPPLIFPRFKFVRPGIK